MDIIINIVFFTAYINYPVVIVPSYVNYFFLYYLTQQFAFFLALQILPRVFNNEGYLRGVPLIIYFLVGSRSTSNIACPLYRFVKDKTLSLTVTHDLNILFAI